MSEEIHIFICPYCRSTDYDAVLTNTTVEEKWTGEYNNILEIETCRYYSCTCHNGGHEWDDYECDHETSGDEDD